MEIKQAGSSVSLITLSLSQNFKLGPLRWENVLTYQKSTDNDILPVPDFNVYSNLYLRFKIARVLRCDFGADGRFYTKYFAPDYSPALGQYAVQTGDNRIKTGGYPIKNVYANFHLKHTRFFAMMSHINAGSGNRFVRAGPRSLASLGIRTFPARSRVRATGDRIGALSAGGPRQVFP